MAEPANKIVLATVKDDCSSNSCPYRYGDESHSKRFLEKIDKKLKYRLADGNEVRMLRKRVVELEVALSRFLEVAEKRKLNPQELSRVKAVLKGKT